jgi:hypothetical protein
MSRRFVADIGIVGHKAAVDELTQLILDFVESRTRRRALSIHRLPRSCPRRYRDRDGKAGLARL